jgi:curved DNA-binding protein CbpA
MADPYEIMGVSPAADEAMLRRRYLELVRQYPPEKSPRQFAEIRAAYDELRDPVARLHQRVFEVHAGESLDNMIADARARVRTARIPTETLLSMAEG